MPRPIPVPTGLTFAELKPGLVLRTFARTVTEADLVNFIAFAGLRMPIFMDANWAESDGPFGGRIAPGFMTASISAGMLETVLGHSVLAGLSIDNLLFPTAVRLGDTLHAVIEVVERRRSRTPDRGIVTLKVNVVNHNAQTALQYRSTVLMRAAAGDLEEGNETSGLSQP